MRVKGNFPNLQKTTFAAIHTECSMEATKPPKASVLLTDTDTKNKVIGKKSIIHEKISVTKKYLFKPNCIFPFQGIDIQSKAHRVGLMEDHKLAQTLKEGIEGQFSP